MNSVRSFFNAYFGWRPSLAQILWTPVTLIAVRIILWTWKQPLPRGEAMYWLIGIPLLLLVGAVASYATKSSRPQLIGSIDRLGILNAAQLTKEAKHEHSMAVLLTVSIQNKGTASIADKWALAIRIKDAEQTIKTIPVYLSPVIQMNVHDAVTGGITPLLGADALYNKTVIAPIATGAMVRGILLYLVDDVTESMLTVPGTKYILQFVDINGRKHDIVHSWPAIPDRRAGYMAGMLQAPGMGLAMVTIPPPEPSSSSKPSS
ncbi:hypothetical protein [Candidatus Binatus sp.]|uniref:hypothetical protein n=1 Tax=Candidatus Binatus sp. TaxID=2811406 RepID=UPI002F91CFC6